MGTNIRVHRIATIFSWVAVVLPIALFVFYVSAGSYFGYVLSSLGMGGLFGGLEFLMLLVLGSAGVAIVAIALNVVSHSNKIFSWILVIEFVAILVVAMSVISGIRLGGL